MELKSGKTDYDAHCTVGVVIAFPIFKLPLLTLWVRRGAVFAFFKSTSSQEVESKSAKTDYDTHCTVGVVIAFAFFKLPPFLTL